MAKQRKRNWIIYYVECITTQYTRWVDVIEVGDPHCGYSHETVLQGFHGTASEARRLADALNKSFAERYDKHDDS